MSAFILIWNQIAGSWATWLLQSGLQSLLVLAIVSALWLVLRRRTSAHFGYALFLLPLIPLALPSFWSIEIPLESSSGLGQRLALVLNETGAAARTSEAQNNAQLQASNHGGGNPETGLSPTADPASNGMNPVVSADEIAAASLAGSNPAAEQVIKPAPAPSLAAWTFLAWLLMTATLLVSFTRIQIRTRRQIQTATPLSDRDQQRVSELIQQLAPQRQIQVLECDGLAGPAAWGVRRPVVLFPPNMIGKLDDDQLAWVLGHELAHHTRYDLVVSSAQRLIQMAWFFNPLLWWQSRQLNHLRECACDESAQARTQVQGKSCAQALIEVVAQSPLRQTPAFALHNLHYDKKTMKLRILRLMNAKRPARAGLAPLAFPLLLAVGSLCTTSFWMQEPIVRDAETESTTKKPTGPLAGLGESPAPTAPSAVGLAQSWLIDQQMADGHWPVGPGFEGPAGEFTNVGVTGLVLISLQNADVSIPASKREKAVQQALKFLKGPLESATTYRKDGRQFQDLASHAVATHAWLLAHRDAANKDWRSTAEKAIQTLIKARNPYGAWGFEFEPNGDANTFNTALAVRALVTAKQLGFDIPRDAFDGAKNFLSEMTDKTTGRVGYSHGNPLDVRLVAKKESHPVIFTELCTAMTLLARDAMGEDVTESSEMTMAVGLVSSKRPIWNPSSASVDYYYWYFGSESMKLVGGVFEKKWRRNLSDALIRHQLGGEGLLGSFPAVDAWSDSKATVHATVMATLALQAVQPSNQVR